MPGSKWRRVSRGLLPAPPPDCRILVEACAGGAAYWFLANPRPDYGVLIDISDDLLNVYRVLQRMGADWFYQQVSYLPGGSRELFEEFSKLYSSPEWRDLPDERRAVVYYWLLQVRFAGAFPPSRGSSPRGGGLWKGIGTYGGLIHVPRETSRHKMIERRAKTRGQHTRADFDYFFERLHSVELIIGDAVEVLPRFDLPRCAWFIDPPYPDTYINYSRRDSPPTPQWYEELIKILAGTQSASWLLVIGVTDHITDCLANYGLTWKSLDTRYYLGTSAGKRRSGERANEIVVLRGNWQWGRQEGLDVWLSATESPE